MTCTVEVSTTSFGNTAWSPRLDEPAPCCSRAGVLAELLSHRRRLTAGYVRQDGELRPVLPDEAVSRAAEVLSRSNAERVGLLVDGNMSLEAVAALVVPSAAAGAASTVYLPSSDSDALEGVAASGASFADAGSYESAGVVVAVGDVFASQPVRARAVLDFLRRRRGNRLYVIDSIPTRTSGFASSFIQVPPDGFVGALAALAQKLGVKKPEELKSLASETGNSSRLDELTAALKEDASPVIVVSPQLGRASDWAAVSALCGLAAVASGGSVAVATSCAAAFGSRQLALKLNAKSPAALADMELDALVVAGLDPVSALGSVGRLLVSKARWVCAMAAMPNATTDEADVVIPLGFPFESTGHVSPAPGRTVDVRAALEPPAGAFQPQQVAQALCRAMSQLDLQEPDWHIDQAAPAAGRDLAAILSAARVADFDPDGLALIGTMSPVGFGDGSVFRQCAWPQNVQPEAEVVVSAGDAQRLGLSAGRMVEVVAGDVRERALLAVDELLPAGVACVDVSFPAGRRLLSWSVDAESDRIIAAGRAVTIEAVAEANNG